MSFSNRANKYFCNLKTPDIKNSGVKLINPYESDEAKKIVKKFYKKFYNDDRKRTFIIGINPGRFGGGLTGIAFTDPVALREQCGIENNLGHRKELSSKFIYTIAERFGGTDLFFSKIFLTALYPFAIIKDGKNYNYYDDKLLREMLKSEIIQTLKSQIIFGASVDRVILLGKKNAEYFAEINVEHGFFKRIIALEHPRFIMQYRLKKIDHYIKKYLEAISS